MEMILKSKTTSSLLVSWSPAQNNTVRQEQLLVQPFPCHSGEFYWSSGFGSHRASRAAIFRKSKDRKSKVWSTSTVINDIRFITGDRGCGSETVTVPLQAAQIVTNVTNLTSGCCYGITVLLATGSVLAENRNVSCAVYVRIWQMIMNLFAL